MIISNPHVSYCRCCLSAELNLQPTPLLYSTTMQIWIQPVKTNLHDEVDDVQCFPVDVGSCDTVHSIKETAKLQLSSKVEFKATEIAIWRTVDKRTTGYSNLLKALKNDRSIIEKICPKERVTDLGLSDGEILVLQIPCTSRILLPEAFSDNLVDKSTTGDDEPLEDTVGELKEFICMFKPIY
jgi:hypothetical protein